MGKADKEPSAFVSNGVDAFPPLYFDNQEVRNFSDERLWPTYRLLAKLSFYHDFMMEDNPHPMPRAIAGAVRITEHIIFELTEREGVKLIQTEPQPRQWSREYGAGQEKI